MPLSTKPFLAFALILTLVAGGPAAAEDGPQLVTLALIDTPWAMRLDVTGFHVQVDGVKPDGRQYLLATDEVHSIQLSVTLETVTGHATEQGCLLHLERVAKTTLSSTTRGLVRDSLHHFSVLEYVRPANDAGQAEQHHLLACTGKDDVYADVHLSQTRSPGDETASLQPLLHRLTIVGAPTPSSLDHFRAGSAPYLLGRFTLAIPHYEQALLLEQANPTLDRPLWQLLVHHLGTAYGRTGNFGQAKATFDYGLSKEPANPIWHYELARTYAGMNDREKTMHSLGAAFFYHHDRRSDERMPDPRQDVAFARFMLDPAFRRLAESLMQPAI